MLLSVFDRRLILVGGKGGVGKTTTAAAVATVLADGGRKCLIVSTDPAHSLGDIFGTDIGDRETALAPDLWGLEIDPDAEADAYIAGVKQNLRGLAHPRLYSEIDRQIDLARHAPGATEAALLERVADLMAEAGGRFDVVLFDTAPTGHTIRLLSLPEIMSVWTDGMLKQQESARRLGALLDGLGRARAKGDELSLVEDPKDFDDGSPRARIHEALMTRRRKFLRARELLQDTAATSFVLVLVPERLPILETGKALRVLERFQLPVAALIINRVLPPDSGGGFLQARRQQERQHLQEIERRFAELPRVQLPLLEHDVQGVQTLRRIGQLLSEQAAILGDGSTGAGNRGPV